MKRIAMLFATVVLALSFSPAQADPWPDDPTPFYLCDLDGHCRYCELRWDRSVPYTRCTG